MWMIASVLPLNVRWKTVKTEHSTHVSEGGEAAACEKRRQRRA